MLHGEVVGEDVVFEGIRCFVSGTGASAHLCNSIYDVGLLDWSESQVDVS